MATGLTRLWEGIRRDSDAISERPFEENDQEERQGNDIIAFFEDHEGGEDEGEEDG